MKLTEKQKLVLAIAIFALTGFILYKTFFPSVAPVSIPTTVTLPDTTGNGSSPVIAGDNMQEGQDILDLADKLNATSIDSEIFTSPVFKSLIDFDAPLSPEPQGRPNPFSTIGIDAGVQNTSGSSATARR